jgi:hypothetical protein
MRRLCAVLSCAAVIVFGVSACGPRQVQVGTAPTSAEAAIHFTNNLPQPVNVYVVQGGTEMFVRQVAANTTENLPVRGVATGTQVRLRAVTIDGKSQFDGPPATLTSMYTWKVP